MITDLIIRARAGDGDAFRELTEPYRRELQMHCYRMLGSFQDAEDVLQDTLLAAWQGLERFEGRASVRTWLYRIATNRCLNALRSASRRPAKEWDVPGIEPPEPTRLGEIMWLEPYPDTLLGGANNELLGPEARYEQTESISLAFVTALQFLPARQRAVLILREVLGYRASEVADMLDATVDSVNSALKHARAGLARRLPPDGRMVNQHSEPIYTVRPAASATAPACSYSPSRATGSAPPPASTPACSHNSAYHDHCRADNTLCEDTPADDTDTQQSKPNATYPRGSRYCAGSWAGSRS